MTISLLNWRESVLVVRFQYSNPRLLKQFTLFSTRRTRSSEREGES